MSGARSIQEQASAMKRWSNFELVGLNNRANAVGWVGTVRPQFGEFKVEIVYSFVHPFPFVRVLEPELLQLPGNQEGRLPHVYPQHPRPVLCLFDPARNEWDRSMLIAETTVPWTYDWLGCYEMWTMTGKWVGGGRHHGEIIPPYAAPPRFEVAS